MSIETYQEWQSDIRSMAAEFADSDQDPSDYAWESADGCAWSIYYGNAWDLVIAMRTHDRAALDAAECDYADVYGFNDSTLDARMCRLAYLMTHAALWNALAQWPTPTTKSRLRALGVNLTQKAGVISIDGEMVCHV